MSKELEIEFKTLLSRDEWQHLIEIEQPKTKLVQTNIYFDDKSQTLKNHGAAFRIRIIENGIIEMTLKTKAKEGHFELNIPIHLEDYQSFKRTGLLPHNQSLETALSQFNITSSSLKEVATLKTTRFEKRLSSDATIMIDHSQYYGNEDFELEMEVTDASYGHQLFTDYLEQHHLIFKKSSPKIMRAIQAKSAQ